MSRVARFRGSISITSSPQARIALFSSTSIIAFSSTTPPQDVEIKTLDGFHQGEFLDADK